MPFDAAALAARYPRDRIASALDVTQEVLGVLLGGDQPDGWDAGDGAALAEARSRADTAIADAVAMATAVLADQYAWSEVEDHPALQRILADLSMFNLYHDVVPEDMEMRVGRADARLKALAAGERLLSDSGEPLPRGDAAQGNSQSASDARMADGSAPLLRRADLDGF